MSGTETELTNKRSSFWYRMRGQSQTPTTRPTRSKNKKKKRKKKPQTRAAESP